MISTSIRRSMLLALGLAAACGAPAALAESTLQVGTQTGAQTGVQTAAQYPEPIRAPAAIAISRPSTANAADDEALTQRVAAALGQDPRITGYVEVSTYGGEVRLRGSVDSVAMIYRAIEIARTVNGVRWINDYALISG